MQSFAGTGAWKAARIRRAQCACWATRILLRWSCWITGCNCISFARRAFMRRHAPTVYDGGVALTRGSNYSSVSDMLANA